ncbi:MAG: alkaline phosphatase [Bacteroidetes bacterium]|nr:alkaline phosphatase [Bacteroidota bacterium]
MKKAIFLTILISLLSCNKTKKQNVAAASQTKTETPKNIILVIGDGMGLSQVSVGQFYSDQASNFDRFTTIGLIKTSSSSHLITDSAAGATAYSSGIKTYNKSIGMKPDSTAITNIVETISKQGMATGLVATSSITHATPAAFYAHTKTRYMYEDIATYLPKSGIDYFAGGGLKFFNKRKDGQNLLPTLLSNNFVIDTVSLPSTVSEKKHAILLAQNSMPKMQEGRGDFLEKASLLAIKKLSQTKEGYFLMVEASQIDWGGHDEDPDYLIAEQLDLDRTLGVLLDTLGDHSETLVIVTADHETGAFSLAMEGTDYNKIKPSTSSSEHSATMVPVFAKGPGAEIFGGIYENNEIYHKMMQLLANN